MACLFLCVSYSIKANDLTLDGNNEKAYKHVLNLEVEEARTLLQDPKTIADFYILSLAESLELLVTEDASVFDVYEDRFESRLDKKIKGTEAAHQFLQAEMRLQWAFVYLKFGHEFDAALSLREAYKIAEECQKKYPSYLPILKTMGLLEVIVGAVPEKYNWVLSLMGLKGSIANGLHDLSTLKESDSPLAFEADLLHALIQGFIFQKPEAALNEVKFLLDKRTDNRLLNFLGGALYLKNSDSELANILLTRVSQSRKGIPVYYADYLIGETLLHKADYARAISSYKWFIRNYKGQNYIKDAYYKIALCNWLAGNKSEALMAFQEAKIKGKESSEADKYAARSLADNELPHVKLSKVRYSTDGGYYAEAQQQLISITEAEIPSQRDKTEYRYRKARLAHKQNQLDSAKAFYKQTIEVAGNEPWYFAPNSCLQLGYIAMSENRLEDAKSHFKRTLEYKKHEYKNSIDAKAKSALAQIPRK
ncbi:tetratricopeptide repeat protein [Chryseosolibacter indicus]|uniref:Tetratricopeptide repeat protein n=1 Tax=Chryseosolibacter indicus TaxID=2782351 RepID=A0ABS5VM87_9BACT|nr:hypothetical protein [Chryseosolibacter indicus]MBT1702568.1 hypothetical protein [Chryseosolibacter indicus]